MGDSESDDCYDSREYDEHENLFPPRDNEDDGVQVEHQVEELREIVESNETRPISMSKPKCCTPVWIVVYIILGVVFIIGGASFITISFLPQGSHELIPIFAYSTIYLPLPPDSPWFSLTKIYISSTCVSTLYQIPCDELHSSLNPNYTQKPPQSTDSHIYCLNGSEFIFNMRKSLIGNISEAEVWISDDRLFKKKYRDKINSHTLTCNSTDKPPGAQCAVFFNGTASITVNLSPPNGQYYYVARNSSLIPHFHVSRYFYNITEYSRYRVGEVNTSKPIGVDLRKDFDPANVNKPNICFLVSASSDNFCDFYTNHYVNVTSERREDVLVWFGFIPLLLSLIIIITIIGHIVFHCIRLHKYNAQRS